MTVLVTGACGQLGCWLRLVASGSAACSTSAENYFSCGSSKNQFPASSNAPAPAANPAPRFLFSDIAELSDESRAMLRKLGGEGVDLTTKILDITDLSAVREMVRKEGVEAVINCAGFTNVDAAESQPETAELLNVKAVDNLAIAMREVNGLLIHISTDYIFGGELQNSPIPEDAPAAPLGVYARTKWEGEQAVRRVGCRHVILRTAWLFSEFGKNFVRTMLRLTAERPQIKVVNDQRGTPTYAADLARVILQLLPAACSTSHSHSGLDPESQNNGSVFNYTNEGECTWYEFAREIQQARREIPDQVGDDGGWDEIPGQARDDYRGAADDRKCEILPCRSEDYPSPVRRPAYSVLDKTRIKAALGLEIPEWRESLRRCLASLV